MIFTFYKQIQDNCVVKISFQETYTLAIVEKDDIVISFNEFYGSEGSILRDWKVNLQRENHDRPISEALQINLYNDDAMDFKNKNPEMFL